MTTLDDVTKDLPKLREVAAYVCCCSSGSFSLSQYGMKSLLQVWRSLGLVVDVSEEELKTARFAVFAADTCQIVESSLVPRENWPIALGPPYEVVQPFTVPSDSAIASLDRDRS